MEKNKKDQTTQTGGPGNQKQNQNRNQNQGQNQNPKATGTSSQPFSADDNNERVRFENEPQETVNQNSDRKPGTTGTNQGKATPATPNQGYKPASNEGLNQGAKQGNDPVTNKRVNQDTETINK